MNKDQLAYLVGFSHPSDPYWHVNSDRLMEVINGTLESLWIDINVKQPPIEQEVLFITTGGVIRFGKRIYKQGKIGPVFLDFKNKKERTNVIRWRYP
ncbi:MAG: hypothetical protein A2W93_14295 [Bacteroidetes bacterium GWF2_43_63]|nr:MAG: hypothetical protein A2W94_00865 [Bacteroidetes bacterium GWE2_42_42]OFY52511.1 MAG: hypothetical protein A2W93_14295 [Bacteroidetes bacterium GWF2_43_63]HBG71418.1 hypothetical protein [Bacteroidales bacterium]HCB60830.1 hypothetical protein [Bacteroidales bacterium]HCY23445.1 hypothetical protein [Bacteroidales bacterium]